MPNTFDPYREALVIETKTVWPDDLPGAPQDESERERIAARLHADPAQAAELDYVRLHRLHPQDYRHGRRSGTDAVQPDVTIPGCPKCGLHEPYLRNTIDY